MTICSPWPQEPSEEGNYVVTIETDEELHEYIMFLKSEGVTIESCPCPHCQQALKYTIEGH